MDEYEQNIQNEAETALKSVGWLNKEADKLIESYYSCKTAHAQNKLIPKLKYMFDKLAFEKRQLEKLLDV